MEGNAQLMRELSVLFGVVSAIVSALVGYLMLRVRVDLTELREELGERRMKDREELRDFVDSRITTLENKIDARLAREKH